MQKIKFIIMSLLVLLGTDIFAQQKLSKLIIKSEVLGAKVLINDREAGVTIPNFAIPLPPGPYVIKISKKGYDTFQKSIIVTANPYTIELNENLKEIGSAPIVITPAPTPTIYTLNINSNVDGAKVFINNTEYGKTPLIVSVAPGNYSVLVKAPGYIDFSQNISVNKNAAVSANLVAAVFSYTIESLVKGAEIFIDGKKVATASGPSVTLQLAAGTYTLTIRLKGFNDFTSQITVGNGSAPIAPVLTPTPVAYTIGSLVKGAEVFIDGKKVATASGPSLTLQILPGTYTITIRLAGFLDFTTQVTISDGSTLTPIFQQLQATVTLNIPAKLITKESNKGKHYGQMEFFVDGDSDIDVRKPFTLSPGRHTLKLVTGFLVFEETFDFEAGKSYTLEPFAGFNLK